MTLTLWLALCLGQAGKEHSTEHFDLYIETLDARETGAMLEQLYAHLKAHFGKAPDRRLRVGIYSCRDNFVAALQADREHVIGGAGGYYSINNGKVYAYLQPSEYYTRHLILHECTHQFHYAVATGNQHPSAYWYQEGFAEYFGMHTWDGKKLDVGVVPAVSLEDIPATALKNFEGMGCNLENLIGGKGPTDRPEGWALVHYLMHQRPKEFKDYAGRLDRREDPLQAWNAVFGPIKPGDGKEFRDWIQSHAQPWKIVWIGWQQRGSEIQGSAQTVGICLLKKARSFKVQVNPQDASFKAGVIFGFKSTDDFYMLQLLPHRIVRILRRNAGAWEILASQSYRESNSPDVAQVLLREDDVVLSVNGDEVASYSTTGQVGLNVESCTALFRIQE